MSSQRESYQAPDASSFGGSAGAGGAGGGGGGGGGTSRSVGGGGSADVGGGSEHLVSRYICGDCTSKVELKRSDPLRCKECGFRILYKERTRRMVQFEAR